MVRFSRCFGLLLVSGGFLMSASAARGNVLANPGFESGLSGWTTFGNVFAETVTPNTGNGVAKMFGNFSGGFNVSGLFQSFPATPGEAWSMDGYFRHNTGDAISGVGPANDNWVVMKFEYRDVGNNVVAGGSVEATVLDGTFATDTWLHAAPISLAAPAGTASVWAFMLYLQPAFAGGAVLMDDMNLVPTPGSAAVLVAAGAGLAARRRRA